MNPSQQHHIHKGPDVVRHYDVDAATRLIDFLCEHLTEVKRTGVKQMLAHRQIKVNDNVTTAATTELQPGDAVDANLTRQWPEFYHRRLHIVYEDDEIIVVNKGYGLLSIAGDGPEKAETAYSILRDYLKRHHPGVKLFIVHRLDRDTSGLMLFAKTVVAKERLQHNWNNMVLERRYVCVTDGQPEPAEGVVRSYLLENSRHEVYSVDSPAEGAQLAITRYRTLAVGGGRALVECQLDTGRKNQIRVHMKQLTTPISGDRRYGGTQSPIHRMALHAQSLRFVHPTTGRDMNFSTPVPASFARLVPGACKSHK